MPEMPPGAQSRAVAFSGREAGGSTTWGIAEEAAVEININGEPLAVMMATPTQLSDLALGFAFTEGVLIDPQAAQGVHIEKFAEGWIADLQAPLAALNEQARRSRRLEGRAGCGLCGVDTLTSAMRRPHLNATVGARPVSQQALTRAFAEFPKRQPLNRATHSVHGAAWCDAEGAIVAVREDVGRHNALDKLAGWLLRDAAVTAGGFVIMSSRLSFELVCKSAAMGACLLAATSAPTSLALELAALSKLSLACVSGDGSIARFEP
jgi:FdhD protein